MQKIKFKLTTYNQDPMLENNDLVVTVEKEEKIRNENKNNKN